MTTPLLYTPAEAAERLAMRESTLRRLVTARAVPHRRVGRAVRFSADDLEQIVAAAEQPPAVAPIRRRRPA